MLVSNVRTGQPAVPSLSLAGNSRAFCFSPNSRYLAAGNSEGVVKVWNTRTWQEMGKHTVHQEHSGRGHRAVPCCVFLKDSRTLVTGDNSGRVVVWDIEGGKTVSTWQAHPSGIRALALAPDGRTLATGGYGNVVMVWHTATWRSMLTLEHPAEVQALAFLHDGQILAIGGGAARGTAASRGSGAHLRSRKPIRSGKAARRHKPAPSTGRDPSLAPSASPRLRVLGPAGGLRSNNWRRNSFRQPATVSQISRNTQRRAFR